MEQRDQAPTPDDGVDGALDGDSAEALERPLPEGVRKRVVGIAADALGAFTAAELPARLRPYVKFTREARVKRGATAIAAALETEPAFRARIAERVRQGQPDLVAALESGTAPAAADPQDVAAAAYLLRTPGWTRVVGEAGDEVERAEHEGAAAESARLAEKLQEELASVRAATRTEAERAKAELDALKKEGDSLRRQLRSLSADTKRAEAATRKAVGELEAQRATGATERGAQDSEVRRLKHRVAELETALEASRRAAREGRSTEEMRLRLLLDTVVQGAQGLQRELGLAPLSGRPADTVEAVVPVAASPHDVARRALEGDDPALLDQLLELPQVHLLVDGYNVTKTGWPGMPLDRQRQQLTRGLGLVAVQTGAEITCVFDGKDLDGPIPMAPPPRGVRVLFSRTGETADELIRRLVRAEPEGRPVVVVSTDREVADGVRASGARPVPSTMLLRRLIRT
ncbi:putative RNA-binding protein with PIN domain/polyhydroxyalkanoate synthesis regulator phasin [Streptacidiphilus sp. MAP12-33]|uniref:NYN domain-containing protein n=1 Tax=Streptacidiphilus sp. MAP12-33 TaxID=3156266 RepID=UPI003513C5B2